MDNASAFIVYIRLVGDVFDGRKAAGPRGQIRLYDLDIAGGDYFQIDEHAFGGIDDIAFGGKRDVDAVVGNRKKRCRKNKRVKHRHLLL